jgi:hypothetical protein
MRAIRTRKPCFKNLSTVCGLFMQNSHLPHSIRPAEPFDGDAMHLAAVAVIIVVGIMPGGAVVPERDRARLPVKVFLVGLRA